MTDAPKKGYVVKLVYECVDTETRWVNADHGRGFSSREDATVFPDLRGAELEAKLWKAMTPGKEFFVVIEPA